MFHPLWQGNTKKFEESSLKIWYNFLLDQRVSNERVFYFTAYKCFLSNEIFLKQQRRNDAYHSLSVYRKSLLQFLLTWSKKQFISSHNLSFI